MNAGRREFGVFFAFSMLLHVAALTVAGRTNVTLPEVRTDTILFRFDRLAPSPTAPADEAAAPRPAPASSASSPSGGGETARAVQAELRPVVRDSKSAVVLDEPSVDDVAKPVRESMRPEPADKSREPALEENEIDDSQDERVASVSRNSSSSTEQATADAAAADAKFEQVRASYEQALSAWLDRHKYYPSHLRRRRLEGAGEMRIRIDRDGTVLYAAMNRSLPHSLLDEVALDWAERANPFPDVPKTISGTSYEFLVPVEFTIR